MPRLMATNDAQVINTPGPGNFQFSAVRIEDLGATEYTLVTIACDVSGSVNGFDDELLRMIKTIVGASQKNPRAENLLLRLITFNHNIVEVHGFKNLSDIDVDAYEPLSPDGFTALYDAGYDAISASLEYSKRLVEQDFDCNGSVFIITDGMDNRGSMTPRAIADLCAKAIADEDIESLDTILIGLHDPSSTWSDEVKQHLADFKEDAKLTEFIDAGDATPQKLAKLANWVSESISSQSQALGTGAPSQSLAF